ncbi:MAG TPA: M20 family metallopeptidase [Patescibacteria group bacterium]|nr:M20 family metallopeptidase [Patescibacteria group bacterium]
MTVESFDLLATAPAEPFADAKRRIAAAVEANRAEILGLSHRIHANPEPAFEERQAAGWVAEAVARRGFVVEHPAGSLETAVRAILPGGLGGQRPRIGILGEYDALPGLGHGCGHNSMAASGVGAAIALATIANELPGEIVFLGTPAEERGSGKGIMIRDGLFDGLEAALLYHPSDITTVECRLLASEDVYVTFHGRQAHAASEPWMGKNALDALILLFTSVGLWRQQLRPDARVHGVVQEGGTAANIIPSRSKAWFMIRSPREDDYSAMRDRFRELCEAAAAAAGCTVDVVFEGGASTMKPNRTLDARFVANMAAYDVQDHPPIDNLGSSDMGNVSQVIPTIHPSIAICATGVPGHSIEFLEAAASPRADEVTLLAATLIAQTAYELFADPSLVEAAWREFRGEG